MTAKLQTYLLDGAINGHSDTEEFLALAAESQVPLAQVFNDLAYSIAQKYATGAMSFEDADAIMNQAWPLALDLLETVSSRFLDVYMAFDAGEYRAPDDDIADNPELKRTKPLIHEYLRREAAQS